MRNSLYEIYHTPKKSKNFIVAAAIGPKAIREWKKYILNNWLIYCKNNNIGLLVFHKYIIKKSDNFWKPATWQKHLFGKYILENINNIENICLLDIDILINPHSPNIFNQLEKKKSL